MSKMDQILSFFTGDNKKVENGIAQEAKGFIQAQLAEDKLETTLTIVDRVVDMENWLFEPEQSGQEKYENESLEKAILIGHEVQDLMRYMKNDLPYQGVELNQDVLKTVLMHFLNTIEVYEFEACTFHLPELYTKVKNTPYDLLKYVIEERQEKLDQLQKDPEALASPEYARRIFEYDLLIQSVGSPDSGENARIASYAEKYEETVYAGYLAASNFSSDETNCADEQGEGEDRI